MAKSVLIRFANTAALCIPSPSTSEKKPTPIRVKPTSSSPVGTAISYPYNTLCLGIELVLPQVSLHCPSLHCHNASYKVLLVDSGKLDLGLFLKIQVTYHYILLEVALKIVTGTPSHIYLNSNTKGRLFPHVRFTWLFYVLVTW